MDAQGMTGETLRNPFADLPEDVLIEILSRTSPWDVSRFAVISKGHKSTADSDTVWERFLPVEIGSRYDSPVILRSKKELFFIVCKSPIRLDGDKLILSIDKKSGKKRVIVGARGLTISWGDSPGDWEWTSRPDSRFADVAQLNSVNWLDIRGILKAQMLSKNTCYGAYMIYKLRDVVCGLDFAGAVVRIVNQEGECHAEGRSTYVQLLPGKHKLTCRIPRQTGQLAVTRNDGWLEIELGSFYNDESIDGEVEARLMEIWGVAKKSGLIVEGIEFRPKVTKKA